MACGDADLTYLTSFYVEIVDFRPFLVKNKTPVRDKTVY